MTAGAAGSSHRTIVCMERVISLLSRPIAAQFRQRDQVLREHCAAIGRDSSEITRSMQTIVRCDDPAAPAVTRALLLEMIEAGVTHIVLAAILGGRPVRWLADEIIEPVLAQARHR